MKKTKNYLSLFIVVFILIGAAGCTNAKSSDLMEGISAGFVQGKSADITFIENAADFSIELFKKTVSDKSNSLISPLSVMLALSMAANGADSETLSQMEKLIGGEISLNDMNEYLYSYVKELPTDIKAKLNIANSIWFRDSEKRLQVDNSFLKKNADYYHASIYKSDYDVKTLNDINNWVKSNTDGMIDKIIDEINKDAVMYLINTVVFDAEWENVYNVNNIQKSDFINSNGEVQNVEFMYSDEFKYIENSMAIGFIKPYDNGYSFLALLPNEDTTIEAYIASLTGAVFLDTLNSVQVLKLNAAMPKFSYEYKIKMNEALKTLGIPDAFNADNADFSKMATSSLGNIYIGEVLHKTYISVDELGTKAGAVTKVEMGDGSAAFETKTVLLNKPFVYAIIDNATNLPIFIGSVMTALGAN